MTARLIVGTISAVLFIVAGAIIANAADIGMKDTYSAPTTAVIASPEINWTGFYVGVQGGHGNANHNLTVEEYHEGKEASKSEVLGNIDGLNSSGFIGGGRLGFDYSNGKFLVGVFGDYDFTNMETTVSVTGLDNKIGLEKQDEWTLGLRAGYIVAPKTLVYGLIGYTQTEYDVTGLGQFGPLHKGQFLQHDATFDGLTVGGGMEYALAQNLFFGLEYQHTFYGDEKLLDTGFSFEGVRCGTRIQDELDEDKILATVKFKFGGR